MVRASLHNLPSPFISKVLEYLVYDHRLPFGCFQFASLNKKIRRSFCEQMGEIIALLLERGAQFPPAASSWWREKHVLRGIWLYAQKNQDALIFQTAQDVGKLARSILKKAKKIEILLKPSFHLPQTGTYYTPYEFALDIGLFGYVKLITPLGKSEGLVEMRSKKEYEAISVQEAFVGALGARFQYIYTDWGLDCDRQAPSGRDSDKPRAFLFENGPKDEEVRKIDSSQRKEIPEEELWRYKDTGQLILASHRRLSRYSIHRINQEPLPGRRGGDHFSRPDELVNTILAMLAIDRQGRDPLTGGKKSENRPQVPRADKKGNRRS